MKYVKTHESFSVGSYRWLIMYDRKYYFYENYSYGQHELLELKDETSLERHGYKGEILAQEALKKLDRDLEAGVMFIKDPYDPSENPVENYGLIADNFEIIKFFFGVQMIEPEDEDTDINIG